MWYTPTAGLSHAGDRDLWKKKKETVLLSSQEMAALPELSPDTGNELTRKSILPGVRRERQWRFR